jgi:hypothetical protein
MRVAIGSDHGGFAMKAHLAALLAHAGHQVVDCGNKAFDPDDLPIEAMRSPEDEALLSGAYEHVDDDAPTIKPSSQGGLRAVASRLFGSGA